MAAGGLLGAAARALTRVDAVLVTLAAAAVFAIMIVVVIDVALRYVFNSPLTWAFDLVGSYLMVISFFFALSETLHRDHHVNVDILYAKFPLRLKQACKLVGWSLACGLFAAMAWLAAAGAWSRYQNHEVVAGAIAWPTWIPAAVGALGMTMITLRLLVGALALLVALLSNRTLDPELAGHDVSTPAGVI